MAEKKDTTVETKPKAPRRSAVERLQEQLAAAQARVEEQKAKKAEALEAQLEAALKAQAKATARVTRIGAQLRDLRVNGTMPAEDAEDTDDATDTE